jgi:hypothetical protein
MNEEKNAEDFFKKIENLDPDLLQKEIGQAFNSFSALKTINDHFESLKYSVRTLWESLAGISSLSAMLLIVASFNPNLISINNSVKIILTVLLFLIPVGVWLGFMDSTKAMNSSLNEMVKIAKKHDLKGYEDFETQIEKARKPTFVGVLPILMYFIFTIAVILIILMVWQVDLLGVLIK